MQAPASGKVCRFALRKPFASMLVACATVASAFWPSFLVTSYSIEREHRELGWGPQISSVAPLLLLTPAIGGPGIW